MNKQSSDSKRSGGFWSVHPKDDSLEGGRPNFWSILETVTAISIFWVIALTWETLIVLYTSIFIVPLLLLRSVNSVVAGSVWFEYGIVPPEKAHIYGPRTLEKLGRRIGYGGLAFGLATSIAMFSLYFIKYKHIDVNRLIFSIAPMTILLSCILASVLAVATSVILLGSERAPNAAIGAIEPFAGIAVSVSIFGILVDTYSTILPLYLSISIAFAGIIAFLFLGFLSVALTVIVYTPMLSLGIFLGALFIRAITTIRYIVSGYQALPDNVRRLALSTSPLSLPELLPGLPQGHNFRIESIWGLCRTAATGGGFANLIALFSFAVLIVVWFLPGWTYRFVLKSTLWFWWILAFLGGTPSIVGGVEGLRADVLSKWRARIANILAAAWIVIFSLANLTKPFVESIIEMTPILPVIAPLVLLDWSSVPWLQLTVLVTSALTILIWVMSDDVVKDSHIKERSDSLDIKVFRILIIIKLKNFLGWSAILLIMIYILLLINANVWGFELSTWVLEWIGRIYGQYAGALVVSGVDTR